MIIPVFRLAGALGRKALDCSAGDLITPQNPSGRHAFQEFRDRVIDASH